MKKEIKIIRFNSKHYWESIVLRDKILRKPLNLSFSKSALLLEESQIHFAYFINYKIVAVLVLLIKDKNTVKMRQVCVDNKHQNKGLGKELLLYVEQWCVKQGYQKIYCHARKNAIEFYAKMNYKTVGKPFIEIGIEHLKLEKKLKQ